MSFNVPLRPLTMKDLLGAVEKLKAANVPTFDGTHYKVLGVDPGIEFVDDPRHAITFERILSDGTHYGRAWSRRVAKRAQKHPDMRGAIEAAFKLGGYDGARDIIAECMMATNKRAGRRNM